MEIDRITAVRNLKKVERTGGEQERRRKREQPDDRFADLLESNLDEEENGKDQNGPAEPLDRVSIAATNPIKPVVYGASGKTLAVSMAQRLAISLKEQAREIRELAKDTDEDEPQDPEPTIDTLA